VLLTDKTDYPDFVGIVDFGLAKLMPHANVEATSVTNTGDVFGSPPYMSPEQCLGKKVDTRADIYSFGCLMYETLTGRPPLLGDTAVATILAQISDVPAPMSDYAPQAKVPPKLEAIIFRALDKDPLSRQQSMAELLRELKDFIALQETGMEYKPVGIKTMVRQRYNRSKRLTIATAFVTGAILLGFIAWWWDWINDWRDGTFRLIGSVAIAAVVGYGLFRLYKLDRKMKSPQVESVIPAISWHEFSPELNAESVRAELDEMLALLRDEKLPDDRETHKKMRNALNALISVKATDDVSFRSQQAIELLQRQGKSASELLLVMKDALAETMVLRKDYARAEALYRELVDQWSTNDDFSKMARTMTQLKLADVLHMENRTADAQTLYSAFLFRSDVLALPKDPTYALRMSRLADCYCSMESYKLAEEHYVKARELWQHLGDNANSSLAFVKYAYTCTKRWKPIEIAEDFSTAVKTIEDSFGKESKHSAAAMSLYSSILWKNKRFDAAVKYRKQADEIETSTH
jgi:tetratricopeptide (TPR) repeat protein